MATNNYPFVCPKCGGHDLMIACEIMCQVIQGGDGNFETQPDKGADWLFNAESFASCNDCYYGSVVKDFEVPNQPYREEESE